MKYNVFCVTKYNDGTNDNYSATGYDNYNVALKIYHQKFANAIDVANVASIMVQIVNDFGVILKNEFYEAPKVSCVISADDTEPTIDAEPVTDTELNIEPVPDVEPIADTEPTVDDVSENDTESEPVSEPVADAEPVTDVESTNEEKSVTEDDTEDDSESLVTEAV